jgi:aryl-phospho-beta-D-glucosidase BglC (GH1 family)
MVKQQKRSDVVETAISPQEVSGFSSSNFLKANGKTLRDNFGTGNVIVLHGTNAGGWLVQESWMCPTDASDQQTTISTLTSRFNAATKDSLLKIYEDNWWTTVDFDNCKNLGMNVIRLPFWYKDLIDDNGNLKSDAWTRLDWFVSNCNSRNIYVILDLHGAPGSQQGADNSGQAGGANLWSSSANMDKTVWLWQQLATHFKGNAAVAGYDLLNEPYGASGSTQWNFYDRIYKAIRDIDPDHVIIIESTWEPNNLPNPAQYGWTNVMYSYHCYCWNADNDYNAQKSFTDSKVSSVKAANYNVPTYIGEFTGFTNMSSWDYILKTYNLQGWSWTTWTYKVTGTNNNWGLYNGNPSKVAISSDSASSIQSKWSGANTSSSFTKNTALCDLFSSYAKSGTNTVIFNNFDTSQGYSAGANATAAYNSAGQNIKLTTSVSGDPGNANQCVKVVPQTGGSVDASMFTNFTFWIEDTQGNNTVKVAMIDTNNAIWSGWTTAAVQNTWIGISLPMNSVTGINKGAIKEIRIGEWNIGTYYVDGLQFNN